ncbi:MAG: hypothetical protein OEZ00_04995 [Dehalococcoidia bacterium]|nr:hypothetical protein [Dehalococcoidia bacterium]
MPKKDQVTHFMKALFGNVTSHRSGKKHVQSHRRIKEVGIFGAAVLDDVDRARKGRKR